MYSLVVKISYISALQRHTKKQKIFWLIYWYHFSRAETLQAKQALCRPDLWPHPNWPPTPLLKWTATTMMVSFSLTPFWTKFDKKNFIPLQAMSGGKADTWAVWTDHLHPRCLPRAHKLETSCTWQVRKSPRNYYTLSNCRCFLIQFNAIFS